MEEQTRGNDIRHGIVDFVVHYKKRSDTLYESLALISSRYAGNSDAFFYDTTIKGKPSRIALYKINKDHQIVIRSEYCLDKKSKNVIIKRYDLDNHLKAIDYPDF